MTTTTTFDFAPLYRHAVGFDRFANMAQKLAEQRLSETCKAKKPLSTKAETQVKATNKAVKQTTNNGYPRYNISQLGEFDYQITLALAGFSLEEIDITVTADELVIVGKKQPLEQSSKMLHQGINQADFSRKFALADHVHVLGADMNQGLLTINLQRQVPEALQPRKVEIGG